MRSESEIISDLEATCTTPGFVHALAHLCFRDNFISMGSEIKASDMEHMFSRSRLIRTEITTLIGLLVKHPIDFAHPGPEKLQSLVDDTERLLSELHDGMVQTLMGGMFDAATKTIKATPFDTAVSLREPIFYGGESAYGFQYRDFAKSKYADDDAWLIANKGFRIAEACEVVATVARLQDRKVQATVNALRSQHPDTWTLLPGFIFTAAEVAAAGGTDISTVQNVLAAFALAPDNHNAGFITLHDYNAVSGTPLLARGMNEYVLLQQYSLFEALYEAPFYWLGSDKAYAPTAMTNRGIFTESLTIDRLRRVFGQHVYPNVDVWEKKGKKLGEIDVLVLFGDRALVLQAKSKRLTLEARKGNDQQIKSDFKKAVQEAYDQALLCAKELLGPAPLLTDAAGNQLAIKTALKIVYPLCVVADHYPALGAQARAFLRSMTTDQIAAPLVVDVFALDAMTEMLETPLHLLSYIDRRALFSSKIVATHEHTILSYHLRRNLWVDDGLDTIALEDDIATDLDIAMTVRREGLPGQRTPPGFLTKLPGSPVGKIIAEIEARADPATIGLGLLLLQMNEDSTVTLNKGIRLCSKSALKDGKNHDITLGFGSASSGVTVHCNPEPQAQASAALRRHCEARKYAAKAAIWYGLALHPDDGTIRFGTKLDFAWVHDSIMDGVVRSLPLGSKSAELRLVKAKRAKPGRNDTCPCGSGRKYKKCCLV